jgi:hypothetical protein
LKKSYYEEKLIQYKNNSKSGKLSKLRELPKHFKDPSTGNVIEEPLNISNEFNKYFVNVGPQLASRIVNNKNYTFDKYLSNKCEHSMFIDPTTEHEVETEINSLKCNKSPGYDGLSATRKYFFKKRNNVSFQLAVVTIDHLYMSSNEIGSFCEAGGFW